MSITKPITELVPDAGGAVELSVDEGGIRCEWRSERHAYIPLRAIADVSVDETFFGGVRLVLQGAHGGELRLHVVNASCVAIQRLLLVALSDQSKATTPQIPDADAILAVLSRSDRTIESWLGSIAQHATGSYRDVAFDPATLIAVLTDIHGDVEARAAASYALLSSADDQHLNELTFVFLMHALPPLVLAVAHAAPGGRALVPDHVAEEMHRFLSETDAQAFAKMASTAPSEEREARVATALEAAKEKAALAHQKEHDDAVAQGSKWRRLHTMAGGADTRWVGKTWAL